MRSRPFTFTIVHLRASDHWKSQEQLSMPRPAIKLQLLRTIRTATFYSRDSGAWRRRRQRRRRLKSRLQLLNDSLRCSDWHDAR